MRKQSRITPKPTAFVPRNPPQRVHQKTWSTDPEVVWIDREGNAFRMKDITDTHLVSIVRMIEKSLANARTEGEKQGITVSTDKRFIEQTDKMFSFLIELAVRGIPYSDVPRQGE